MGPGLCCFIGRAGSSVDHLHYLPTSFCARHFHEWSKGVICVSLIFFQRKEVMLLARLSHFSLNLKLPIRRILRFEFLFCISPSSRSLLKNNCCLHLANTLFRC